MTTIGTKQQNRSKRAATVLLDNQTQGIQNLFECDASGDHFEKTLFTGEQRFPSLALANVYRGSSVMIDLAGLAEDRSSHPLDMLNRSVRKRDSKFHVKAAFFANCSIEILLNN